VFYPPAIAIKDEAMYLAEAYVLRAGTIFSDVAGVPVWISFGHAGHTALVYPPGMGALLLPFTFFDWRAVFVLNLVLQVGGFLLFRQLLKDVGLNPGWAVLYLFFPPLLLFSRTVMTEVPSTLATVAALVLYSRGRRGLVGAGLVLGLSLFLRYANLVVFGGLVLGALTAELADRRSPRSMGSPWLVAGFVPGFLLFSLYNLAAHGQLSAPGYAASGVHLFGPEFLPRHLVFYGFALLAVYPLMLVAPLVYRGPLRREILVMTATVVLVMSAYYYVDDGHGLAQNLLVGYRLLLPVVPAFLVAYVGALERLPLPRLALPAVTAILFAVAVVVSVSHQAHLRDAAAARDLITRNTCQAALINDEATKFFSPAWGSRPFTVYDPARPDRLPDVTHADVVYADINNQGLDTATQLATKLGDHPAAHLQNTWQIQIWTGC
jgi:hypothetical protein